MDEISLNLTLVDKNVRRAWLASGNKISTLRAKIKEMGLALKCVTISVEDPPIMKKVPLVIKNDDNVDEKQTHVSVAKLLGIPCGSKHAHLSNAHKHAFIVWATNDRRECRSQYWDPGAMVVTSFWCSDYNNGYMWCKEFKEKTTRLLHDVHFHFQSTSHILCE